MSSNNDVTPSAASEHLLGRVKWFNNKAGYGFITVTDGKRSGTDVFVHHSAVNVENQQYKYLVQGEYVEFTIVDTPSGKHECQASNVNGIKGGKLMCTTRLETNIARSNYKKVSTEEPKTVIANDPVAGEWVKVSTKTKDSGEKRPRGRPAKPKTTAPKTTTPKKDDSK